VNPAYLNSLQGHPATRSTPRDQRGSPAHVCTAGIRVGVLQAHRRPGQPDAGMVAEEKSYGQLHQVRLGVRHGDGDLGFVVYGSTAHVDQLAGRRVAQRCSSVFQHVDEFYQRWIVATVFVEPGVSSTRSWKTCSSTTSACRATASAISRRDDLRRHLGDTRRYGSATVTRRDASVETGFTAPAEGERATRPDGQTSPSQRDTAFNPDARRRGRSRVLLGRIMGENRMAARRAGIGLAVPVVTTSCG